MILGTADGFRVDAGPLLGGGLVPGRALGAVVEDAPLEDQALGAGVQGAPTVLARTAAHLRAAPVSLAPTVLPPGAVGWPGQGGGEEGGGHRQGGGEQEDQNTQHHLHYLCEESTQITGHLSHR